MATIGSLAVNIVASTDKFIAGLNQAQTVIGRFVKKIGTVQNAIVGLGAYAFANFVNQVVEMGAALHDTAQKLNISTEALSALQHATRRLGGDTGAVSNALIYMNRRIGQAQMGASSAQKAFSQLGLDFNALIDIPVEQRFLAIVDAINRLPTETEKAAASQAIFGRGAKDLTALINGGTEAIRGFAEEAVKAGAIVSSDVAAGLDEASDAMGTFSSTFANTKLNIVGEYAPEIVLAMDLLVSGIKAVRFAFALTQGAIVTGFEIILRAILLTVQGINILLPKFAEIPTDFLEGSVEQFAEKRKELRKITRNIFNPDESANPLAAPADNKQVAANTKTTNEKLDQVIAELQASRGNTQLAPAGMR